MWAEGILTIGEALTVASIVLGIGLFSLGGYVLMIASGEYNTEREKQYTFEGGMTMAVGALLLFIGIAFW
jgi:hypothetical protein